MERNGETRINEGGYILSTISPSFAKNGHEYFASAHDGWESKPGFDRKASSDAVFSMFMGLLSGGLGSFLSLCILGILIRTNPDNQEGGPSGCRF